MYKGINNTLYVLHYYVLYSTYILLLLYVVIFTYVVYWYLTITK
jgi:hypothetical protein